MKKKLISLIFALLTLFSLARPAMAANLDVTCDDDLGVNGDCVMSPSTGAALFEEANWLPGDTVTRTITIDNTENADDCDLMMNIVQDPPLGPPTQTPADFATRLWTVIKDGVIDLYGVRDGVDRAMNNKVLDDLYLGDIVGFGVIPAGASQVFDWTVTFDLLAGNEYQNAETEFDFALNFVCGEAEAPALMITKDNDRKNDVLDVDDIVSYTVTITNNGPGTAYDVVLEDIQPVGEYFDYLEGSGVLKLEPSGPTTSPTVTDVGGNRYLWTIGDILSGQTYTLTYQLQILSVAIPGTHHNFAIAHGTGDDGLTHYSNLVLDPIEVGGWDLSGSFGGQVLGAAISQVGEVLGAATGSKTFWLIFSLVMILLGIALKMLARKRFSRVLKDLLLIVGLASLVMVGVVSVARAAQTVAVAIVQLPEYLNKRDPEISYTALDVKGAGLSVHLEYKKEGEGWKDLGTYNEPSLKIGVGSDKITGDHKYHFRATACVPGECAVSETWTKIDVTAPPPPENYSKEKIGVQSYKIKWHNPDHEDIYKVYIYRSDKRDFDANDSTKVGEKTVSKNTDSEWTDSVVPDSSKEYYYVIRSVDRAGNGSDLVGETYTVAGETIEVPGGEAVSGQEAISGQVLREEEVVIGVSGVGEETTEATGEGEILGGEEDEGEAEPAAKPARRSLTWLLILAAAGLIVTGYWFFKPKSE